MTARVLVVDDILSNVKLLEAKLSAEYFEEVTAFNGMDALARMEEMKITSLVVVDAERNVQGVVHLHDLWTLELM